MGRKHPHGDAHMYTQSHILVKQTKALKLNAKQDKGIFLFNIKISILYYSWVILYGLAVRRKER